MTNVFWPADLLLALAVVVSFVYPAFLVLRNEQIKSSMLLSAEFFENSGKLVEDEGVPDLVISYLEEMVWIINDPKFSRKILGYALSGKLRDTTNKPSARSQELMAAIHGMRKELKDIVARASVACILSATYKSLIFGGVVRRMMLFSIERDQEQAQIVVSNLSSNRLENRHAHAA